MFIRKQELLLNSTQDEHNILVHLISAVDSEVTSWGGVIVSPGPKAYEKEEKPEGTGETMDSEESTETAGEAMGDTPAAETPVPKGEEMETEAS